MTTDARKLDRKTQAHLRRQVVLGVRSGMTQSFAGQTYGLSLRAVQKACAKAKSGSLSALKKDGRGRPAGHTLLSVARQAKLKRIVLGKLPDQLKLPFYLWTRQAVAALAKREFAVVLSGTTVGRYLKAWGFTPQKPVRRAYERNDAAIAAWLSEQYPLVVKEAKREKAQIYWGDEMGLRSDHVSGKSYAPAGQTPEIRATGQRFGCNMISAITNKGALSFMIFEGKFNTALFVDFLRRLIKSCKTKVYLVIDGHPVHRSGTVKAFEQANADKLRLIRLPGYCPELNPDELLNQDVKTNALGKSRPTNKAQMIKAVRSHLHRRQKQPQVIRNLFKERHVQYAA